jgi:CDP-glucose 4,6-dehydratase
VEGLGVRPGFWAGRRVLVTGHTGFKGAWTALWLLEAGAEVSGLALAPETRPALFDLLGLAGRMRSALADINDAAALAGLLAEARPELVLHLAAQSLVRRSYRDPVGTFAANVTGTVSLLHAASRAPSVRAVVVVTSDKAYENAEWDWGYRESDPLGGRDPYSASKGCAELATAAMRRSYFAPHVAGGHPARIATARAGNVIGGGDWAEDRLVPDIVRGCLGEAGAVSLRAPGAVRPWQHVLEPVRGYLMLAEALCDGAEGADSAWNFGPSRADERPVIEVARAVVAALGRGRIDIAGEPGAPHEARLLTLDNSKARARLGWRPALGFAEAVAMTAEWYGAWARGEDPLRLSLAQIAAYRHLTEAA